MQLPFESLTRAIRHLRRKDPTIRPIFSAVGPCTLVLDENRFHTLAGAIIAQQISTQVAAAIEQRLIALASPHPLTPEFLKTISPHKLRSIGLSAAKSSYLQSLAQHLETGLVCLDTIHERDDEGVISELVQVKGIGRWTAEMFLIFCLGRLDVLPVGDFGLRAAVQIWRKLPELPNGEQLRELAAPWAPYRSIATWYLWKWLGLQRQAMKQPTRKDRSHRAKPSRNSRIEQPAVE